MQERSKVQALTDTSPLLAEPGFHGCRSTITESSPQVADQLKLLLRNRSLSAWTRTGSRREVAASVPVGWPDFEGNAFAEILDLLSVAILLVDHRAGVFELNAAAMEMLARSNSIQLRGGALEFTLASANRALRAALVQGSSKQSFVPIACESGATTTAAIIPVKVDSGLFAVFIPIEEVEVRSFAHVLRDIFKLTPRELAVLLALLDGWGLDDVARHLGIALTTAKSHLSQLFAKTGTARQADLIRRVSKAIPPIRI
jgi:DNA-binding CsgD family transcriptional regulator